MMVDKLEDGEIVEFDGITCEVVRLVDEGTFNRVYSGYSVPEEDEERLLVAIRQPLDFETEAIRKPRREFLERSMELTQQIPEILEVVAGFLMKSVRDDLMTVVPWVEGLRMDSLVGNLRLHSKGPMGLVEAIKKAVLTLAKLEAWQLIHGDVFLSNIVLSDGIEEGSKAILIDPDVIMHVDDARYRGLRQKAFLPELVNGWGFHARSDMYGLGKAADALSKDPNFKHWRNAPGWDEADWRLKNFILRAMEPIPENRPNTQVALDILEDRGNIRAM